MTVKSSIRIIGTFLAAGLMIGLAFAAFGCGNQNTSAGGAGGSKGGAIQVKGSDTMVNLAQMWAEDYMKENPQVNIAVTGGGSGTGITAIINGTTDVADSSREMKQKEKDDAAAKGVEVVENKVALDGIAVVVNSSNGVGELSVDQLADIFSGKITDWQEVGGSPGQIVILSRESNSGTHVFFKEHILNKGKSDGKVEYASSALLLPSSQAIVDEVKQNPKGIGYVGLGYVDDSIKAVKVKKDATSTAVTPTVATVQDGSYPVSRPLYMYSKQGASQTVQDYLAWIKGPEGQKVVEQLEFVPLTK
ncbi:MAG: phosphate ABC transporter substrate-binding protein [Thermoleophilia bacterium]|nr:phosphate ABC transporter substrate-binding protein [Thermoleophilia bacterium]